MAVPTTGSFLMFGTGSNTTIAGAIIQGGASSETVASTLNFNALKALANINKFDAEFKEGATTLEQIVKSTQFRGYPISLPVGRSWSSGGALSTGGRYQLAGAGTQNAGLAFGGNNGYPNTAGVRTEEYNGTLWSAGGNLITGKFIALMVSLIARLT